MADQTIRFPEGLAKDVLVKLCKEYVPVDFVVLDIGGNKDTPLSLRHSSTARMHASTWGLDKFTSASKIERKSLPLQNTLTNRLRQPDPKESHNPPHEGGINLHEKSRTNSPNHNHNQTQTGLAKERGANICIPVSRINHGKVLL